MTDLERTNLERPRINSNTTSNNPERITQKWIFFTIIWHTKRKQTYKLSYKTKDVTYEKNLQYDEMNWKKKKDYVTLNKYDS